MITLTEAIQNGNDPAAPYTHAAVRKVTLDDKDEQLNFVLGFGDGSEGMVYSELAMPRRFTMRKDVLLEGKLKWEMPEDYYASIASGVGGPVLKALEQRLVSEGILEGTVS